MDLFEKQVKHYTDKYNDTKKIFDERDYSVYQNMLNVKDIKKELIANTELFEKFVLAYSRIMPGKVSCTTYAAAVAKLCDDLGIKYKIYTGFCIPKSYAKYAEDKKAYEDKKSNGIEHPMFPTHVYLEADIKGKKKIYEYYNGDKDIDHIDVSAIA